MRPKAAHETAELGRLISDNPFKFVCFATEVYL